MKQCSKVICVGEMLIDFFCKDIDVNLSDGARFEKQAGGAPANVTAAISRLGGEAAFVGKVGADPFGTFLKKTLDDEGVNTEMLSMSQEAPTTLAFVSLQADGERDFIFNRGADQLVKYEDLDVDSIRQGKVLHFGSATALLDDPFQSTYLQLIDDAVNHGAYLSFDPNYRQALWQGRTEEFIHLAKKGIAKADFVKVSEEELNIISSTSEIQTGVATLHELGAKVVAVTLGKKGTFISNGENQRTISSIAVKSIDSTGAGDAFVGATLFQISQLGAPKTVGDDFDKLVEIIQFSNIVGASVCTKLGAISALPTLAEVEALMA